jgi:hypothetical protein
MFKKTPVNPQFDLFSMLSTQPDKREAKKYDIPTGGIFKPKIKRLIGYKI